MVADTRIPNCFIVGAPKCGTTALNEYLGQHPDIFMARKEMHFLGSDLVGRLHTFTRDTYLQEFANWQDETIGGEASVYYLYSRNAAAEIKAFSPDARIIIMLRNPLEVVYSHYHQLLYIGNEILPTFEEALAAETDRANGMRVPEQCDAPFTLQYRGIAKFGTQVRRYLETFSRDRVHIIIYDDFKRDTQTEFSKVLDFLGVSQELEISFDVINANKRVRSRWLQLFIKHPPFWASNLSKLLGSGIVKQRIRNLLISSNTVHFSREPLSPDTQGILRQELEPEIEQLSTLIDRDLMHWVKFEPESAPSDNLQPIQAGGVGETTSR